MWLRNGIMSVVFSRLQGDEVVGGGKKKDVCMGDLTIMGKDASKKLDMTKKPNGLGPALVWRRLGRSCWRCWSNCPAV